MVDAPERPADDQGFVRTNAGGGKKIAAGGGVAAAIALILGGVYAVEGGYVHDSSDPGGATRYGVTEEVARAAGFHGDMRAFPMHCDGPAKACADNIYVSQYIVAPGYLPMVEIEPAVAAELVDTAVNMGPARPNRWYRQTMNVLASTRLPDSTAALGTDEINAYRMAQVKLGKTAACVATLDALDGRQETEYQRLVARNGALRRFLRGWLRNRIGNVDRSTCGKGS
jgi:lysozyme family protein